MSHQSIKRVNWFDSQNVTENDLDTEQTAWSIIAAENADAIMGSGVEKEKPTQVVLFDTDNVPSSIAALITSETFDGEPIYAEDSSGNVVFTQPSDSVSGNQLEVEISGSSLVGIPKLKVYIFGLVLGDAFVQEVIEFEDNGNKITRNYFTNIVSIMTQDFAGNSNTIIDGTGCRVAGGRLRIMEALPLTVAPDHIMIEQSSIPNMDYTNFKPAAPAKTLDILLSEIAESQNLNKDDLGINVGSTGTRELPINSVGFIVGEKFLASTNNIQKVSILLSVTRDDLATPGKEYDWSGNMVVGIRALQKTTSCPVDTLPNSLIEFDPEPSALAEVSFNQSSLADVGVSLNETAQVVDFVFTQSLLANPNIEPSLVPGNFYVLTIGRTGDLSKGTIILEEAANTNSDPTETDNMRLTVFSQNEWVDVPESDLWFKIYTDAIRVTNGTAYDSGVAITSPKTSTDSITGVEVQYINGKYNLIDVSSTADNYVIMQKTTRFSDTVSHPVTGNPIFSRIQDYPSISIVSESTLTDLIAANNETIVLGSVKDTNPVNNEQITGLTEFPGLAGTNTFEVISPISDFEINNLVGSVLVPNVIYPDLKYRIIKVEIFTDAYGDSDLDGSIDSGDVVLAQALDGYSISLSAGTVPAADQLAAIAAGTVTMAELLRTDVNGDGVIDILDASLIQQRISLGIAFPVGASFKRAVLTVEDLTDPLNVSPNIVGSDASFNAIPFSPIQYRIDFIPIWSSDNLIVTDLRRFIPKTFTSISESDITGTIKSGGKNDFYIPGDLLLSGNILSETGESYNFDFETCTITIDLPEGEIVGELGLFENYIKNKLKFHDGTLVSSSALDDNQVKVSLAIQSISKDSDGYDIETIDGNAPITLGISVLYIASSGAIRIRTSNIRRVSTRPEISTKIIATVYLKKAGFTNDDVSVSSAEFTGLLTPL